MSHPKVTALFPFISPLVNFPLSLCDLTSALSEKYTIFFLPRLFSSSVIKASLVGQIPFNLHKKPLFKTNIWNLYYFPFLKPFSSKIIRLPPVVEVL